MRDSFIFYRSFFEATKPLENEQKAELFNAICEYALNKNETEMSPITVAMFSLIKPQLDANYKKFENGKKAKQKQTVSKKKQTRSKKEANVNVNVNVNDNVNVNKNKENSQCAREISLESPTIKQDLKPCFAWVVENTPSLVGMKQPLDEDTTAWFNDNYPEDVWKEVFEAMENYPNIKKKYTSAKSTANNWLKRRGWLSYERMMKATPFEAKETLCPRAMEIFKNKNPMAFNKIA